MPDQNPVDPTATGPVASFKDVGAASDAPPPPPPMDGSDLPPAPPIVEPAPEAPPISDTGGAAPTFDISSSISGTPPPKKKFGGRKFVATILGLLVLVGGLGAGIILVQQQQDIRERAASSCYQDCINDGNTPSECRAACPITTPTPTLTPTATRAPTPPTPTTTPTQTPSPPASSCIANAKCIGPGESCCSGKSYFDSSCFLTETRCGTKPGGTPTPTPTPTSGGVNICALSQRDPTSQGYCDRSAPNTQNCTDKKEGSSCNIVAQCGGGTGTCVVINQGGANSECQCQKGVSAPAPTLTPPPGGGVVAQCLNIRAFDTNWTELTTAQLPQLKAGDKVRFAVGGTASGGSFDKAKFKINGVERAEVTGKRPDSQEFFDEYTIPAGVTTFTINAQIHHASLGWSN